MSHKNKVPLVDQVLQTLNSKFAIGRSETKPREITSKYIFSWDTFTEDGIYQKLYMIYFPAKKETLETMYPLWVEKRKGKNLSDRTIHRSQNQWDKYYKGSPMMNRRGVPIEDIRWYLGHSDIATTRIYILNNQSKQETTKTIVNALSDMNGLDVLMDTQIS